MERVPRRTVYTRAIHIQNSLNYKVGTSYATFQPWLVQIAYSIVVVLSVETMYPHFVKTCRLIRALVVAQSVFCKS